MDYYQTAKSASLQIGSHSGLNYLLELCKTSNRILDVGCGEGSRLRTLLPKDKTGWGIDISPSAIAKAKSQYPGYQFRVGDACKLPYPTATYDLVYSAFALEHTKNPEKFISEMIRVAKPGGFVVILCPNFGAPNRRSPVSHEPPISKLVQGFKNDFYPQSISNWKFVTPKKTYTRIDDDTTVEPYLHSLLRFLSLHHLKIIKSTSVWDQEIFSLNPRKLLIKSFGQSGVFPFKYWGPQIFVVSKKMI